MDDPALSAVVFHHIQAGVQSLVYQSHCSISSSSSDVMQLKLMSSQTIRFSNTEADRIIQACLSLCFIQNYKYSIFQNYKYSIFQFRFIRLTRAHRQNMQKDHLRCWEKLLYMCMYLENDSSSSKLFKGASQYHFYN